jgi:hypothetical protein
MKKTTCFGNPNFDQTLPYGLDRPIPSVLKVLSRRLLRVFRRSRTSSCEPVGHAPDRDSRTSLVRAGDRDQAAHLCPTAACGGRAKPFARWWVLRSEPDGLLSRRRPQVPGRPGSCVWCRSACRRVVHLTASDIDSERMVIRVGQGKGKRDR